MKQIRIYRNERWTKEKLRQMTILMLRVNYPLADTTDERIWVMLRELESIKATLRGEGTRVGYL